jgi:hypothetical protein
VEAGERLEQGKATHVSANATDASQGSEGNLGASSQQAIPIDLSGKNASRQEDAPAQGAHTRETVADSTLLAFPVGERCTVGEQTSNPERKDAATECMCNLFNSVLLHEKIQCESCNFAFKAVKKAQNVQEILSRIQGFKVPDSRPPPPPQAIGIEERLSVTHRCAFSACLLLAIWRYMFVRFISETWFVLHLTYEPGPWRYPVWCQET